MQNYRNVFKGMIRVSHRPTVVEMALGMKNKVFATELREWNWIAVELVGCRRLDVLEFY